MKYYEFEKCGIHSRLKNIIKLSGGYNYILAGELLMKEYGIRNRDIAYKMAENENIREEIEVIGLEEVIKLTEESIRIHNLRVAGLANTMRRLNKEMGMMREWI